MKWTKKSSPLDGQTRVKRGFLLFPKRIGKETRWLECASWVQVYYVDDFLGHDEWENHHWL